jgi:hypothetical protein
MKINSSRFKQLQRQPIFLLQLQQTRRAHATFIILTDILHFVQIELYGAALAFGERICLALHAFAASLTGYDLVFGLHGTKIEQGRLIKRPCLHLL